MTMIATVVVPPVVWTEEQIKLPFDLRLHDPKEVVLEKLNARFSPCSTDKQGITMKYGTEDIAWKGEAWVIRCRNNTIVAAGSTILVWNMNSETVKDKNAYHGLTELEIKKFNMENIPSLFDEETFKFDEEAYKYAITTPPWYKKNGKRLMRSLVVEVNKVSKTILFQEWRAWNKNVRVKLGGMDPINPQICFNTTCYDIPGDSNTYGSGTGGSSGCGSRGGPGFRKPNGQCASWRDL